MKKYLKFMFLAIFALIIASCEKDELPEEEIPQNCNMVEVTENITQPTIWTEGNVYVIKRTIQVRNVLTIEPGVIVKLKDGRVDVIDGKILASGTTQKRIVFTSFADDRYCGDTNGDGVATKPEKGDWKMLYIQGGTGNVFKNVDFFYAGQNSGGYYNAVNIGGSTTTFEFDNCRFAHTLFNPGASYENATAFHSGSYMTNPETHKFTNNAFFDNGKPLYVWTHYTVNPNNKFHNPENPQQKNSHNGITLVGGSTEATVKWHVTEVPYILDERIQVFGSQVIDIGPNVVVKFKRTGAGISRNSASNVILHSTAILTSFKDDSVGGDTNGDGNATTPAKGDWLGLYNNFVPSFYETSTNIRYAKNP